MALSSTITDAKSGASLKFVYGSFTQAAGDLGGDISTGLNVVRYFGFSITSHIGTQVPKVTFTTSSGTVTIVTSDDVEARWFAFGEA